MAFFHQIISTSYLRSGGPPPPVVSSVTYSAEGGSLYFNTGTNYLTFPASQDWALGTGDYTIEWWQWMTPGYQYPRPFSVGSFPSASIAVSIEGGSFYLWSNGGVVASVALSNYEEQWVHFAVSRASGTVRIFQNGAEIASVSNSSNITADNIPLVVGNETNVTSTAGFTGYITNFRWTKGEAIYTTQFTVPNQPLTVGANTKLLLLAASLVNATVDSTDLNPANSTDVSWERVGPYSRRVWLDAGNPSSYTDPSVTWGDLSGFDNDVTLTNTTFGLLQGGYLDFGATGNGVFVSNPATITELKTPSASMTMWANIQQGLQYGFVAGLRGVSGYGFWFLCLDNAGLTEARVETSQGVYDINADFTPYYGTWAHICFTANNTVSQLYINGVLVGTNSNIEGTWGTAPAQFRIASEVDGWNQTPNLKMATFQYHTRARTAAEVLAEFNAERSRFGL